MCMVFSPGWRPSITPSFPTLITIYLLLQHDAIYACLQQGTHQTCLPLQHPQSVKHLGGRAIGEIIELGGQLNFGLSADTLAEDRILAEGVEKGHGRVPCSDSPEEQRIRQALLARGACKLGRSSQWRLCRPLRRGDECSYGERSDLLAASIVRDGERYLSLSQLHGIRL